ncbi:transglutaminase, partial [Mesorhizobium sp. M2D.F.Ca.ET.145.01.1.1]
EDYALEKRRELNSLGIAIANLLMTVVRKPDGEGHAVLTVRTDKGDFILDNLVDKVRLWNQTPYRYLKRQASDDTGRWVSILAGEEKLVSAVK